jgi:cardiolipin synthase
MMEGQRLLKILFGTILDRKPYDTGLHPRNQRKEMKPIIAIMGRMRFLCADVARVRPLEALMVVLLAGCATSQEKRFVYHYEPSYGVASEDFQRVLAALGGGLLPGNQANLLNNGDSFFPAILDAIREAKHTVNIELYIFAKGRMADTFVEALCKKAHEGVQVRVLVDAVGERLGQLDERMKAEGVNFKVYKPTKLRSISKISDRTHRKIITVDGRIGFTGGLAIDDRWAGDARNPQEWRDTVVRLEGPVVLQMQRLFLENWLYTTGDFLDGEGQFPVAEQPGQIKAQAIGSSRTSQLSMAKLHYYLPMQAARRCIWIENAYFLPDEDFQVSLAAAARRGVDVRVVVPGAQTDLQAVRYSGRRDYRRLLEAGVRIYEFQPTMLHAKVMMVDDIWCSIGSINFTARSMKSNAEANVALYDAGFAEKVQGSMEADMARCEAITLEQWKRRGLGERIKECYYGLYKWVF